MQVDPATATEHGGQTVYCCSASCRAKFEGTQAGARGKTTPGIATPTKGRAARVAVREGDVAEWTWAQPH